MRLNDAARVSVGPYVAARAELNGATVFDAPGSVLLGPNGRLTGSISLAGYPVTVGGWLRADASGFNQLRRVMGLHNGQGAYGFRVNLSGSNGFIFADSRNPESGNSAGVGTVEPDTWVSFAGRFNADNMRRAVLNGAINNSVANIEVDPSILHTLHVGADQGSTLIGNVSNMWVYAASLTVPETAALAEVADPREVRTDDLLHYWDGRIAGGQLLDVVGTNHLTFEADATWSPDRPPVA